MPTDLTPNQIKQLADLGISSTNNPRVVPTRHDRSIHSPILPLLSISGLTLISFGGLVLLKTKSQATISDPIPDSKFQIPDSNIPTQVPKSIQHYLLTSQQEFSKALQLQNADVRAGSPRPSDGNNSLVNTLNAAIVSATEAIQKFPNDYRGYQQRAAIYISLLDSKPELIDSALSDLTTAFKLNPNSAEISRNLASLFAKKGDANSTITYLIQTVALEPTKAQNFYDLAKIQQQVGLIADALKTYQQLLPLIPDPTQQQYIQNEVLALENLVNQKHVIGNSFRDPPSPSPTPSFDSKILEAQLLTDTGLIIAAPEEIDSINVKNQTDSNSLAGSGILPANQTSTILQNNNLTPDSQVYVTIISGGKNQNLQVLSKTDSSFTVGLDSPIGEDIEFKYWIIN